MSQDPIIQRLIRWGRERPAVRAMFLTGSRAQPDAQPDTLSDYDILLVVEDIHPFWAERGWLDDFGRVLVAYWDPIHAAPGYDLEQTGNVVTYQDGLKVDFILWPVELLRQIVRSPTLPPDLDLGYVALLDKDGLSEGLAAPTYSAYILTPPTDKAYQKVIQDFFSDVPYVAKCLHRDELLPAKWCMDCDMKHTFMLQMLEWRAGLDCNWSRPAGFLGRGLKKRLPPEIWSRVENSYAGGGIEENWDALLDTLALFRRVAVEVGERLGFKYPIDMDRQMVDYAQQVRNMSPAQP